MSDSQTIRKAGLKARDELLERIADGGTVDSDLADYLERIVDACVKAATSISPVELMALKKLALISNALASSLSDATAAREQKALTRVLVDVVSRADSANTPTI